MLLRRGLAEQGIDAIEAEDGQQALDMLATEAVDLILLDLLMPVLDGYATLERIKGDDGLRHHRHPHHHEPRQVSTAEPTVPRRRREAASLHDAGEHQDFVEIHALLSNTLDSYAKNS